MKMLTLGQASSKSGLHNRLPKEEEVEGKVRVLKIGWTLLNIVLIIILIATTQQIIGILPSILSMQALAIIGIAPTKE